MTNYGCTKCYDAQGPFIQVVLLDTLFKGLTQWWCLICVAEKTAERLRDR